jgi:hypothetical protein
MIIYECLSVEENLGIGENLDINEKGWIENY